MGLNSGSEFGTGVFGKLNQCRISVELRVSSASGDRTSAFPNSTVPEKGNKDRKSPIYFLPHARLMLPSIYKE